MYVTSMKPTSDICMQSVRSQCQSVFQVSTQLKGALIGLHCAAHLALLDPALLKDALEAGIPSSFMSCGRCPGVLGLHAVDKAPSWEGLQSAAEDACWTSSSKRALRCVSTSRAFG